jgi:hypothetical protein
MSYVFKLNEKEKKQLFKADGAGLHHVSFLRFGSKKQHGKYARYGIYLDNQGDFRFYVDGKNIKSKKCAIK